MVITSQYCHLLVLLHDMQWHQLMPMFRRGLTLKLLLQQQLQCKAPPEHQACYPDSSQLQASSFKMKFTCL
jgi:hypothetical protein